MQKVRGGGSESYGKDQVNANRHSRGPTVLLQTQTPCAPICCSPHAHYFHVQQIPALWCAQTSHPHTLLLLITQETSVHWHMYISIMTEGNIAHRRGAAVA
uniref:Uncharacterized protein n=1 Tax=Eutreptiella gymnastica TaxID=73025 RepID=A0A7S1I6D2_9EUGL